MGGYGELVEGGEVGADLSHLCFFFPPVLSYVLLCASALRVLNYKIQ